MFGVGARVRHKVTGETGYVLRQRSGPDGDVSLVGSPSGEWEIKDAFLEAADAGPESAFARLAGDLRCYPYDVWLRREAQRLADAYRNDPASILSNSRVEPQPHQISVLTRVLEKSQARMILADEVGLGKTIEAGLVLKELKARGIIERVLILAPASLVTQWVFELRSKFNEDFQVYDGAYLRHLRDNRPDHNPWTVHHDVICSINLARLEQYREEIVAADWDLVIVDEAHHARNWWNNGDPRPNLAFELLEELRDRVSGLLLLTATPMQLHEFELYSLTTLVEPGLFDSFADFQTHRSEIRRINEHVAELSRGAPAFARRVDLLQLLRRLNASGELLSANLDDAVDRERVSRWLERQHRLSTALVRNRKAQVGGFVQRQARRIAVTPSAQELRLEVALSDYIVRQYRAEAGRSQRAAAGFVLVAYQKMLCSSSRAVAKALERRRNRLLGNNAVESAAETDDADLLLELESANDASSVNATGEAAELGSLIALAKAAPSSKLEKLDETLRDLFQRFPDEKVIIFTQFLETLEMIRERLARHLRVGVFHGGLNAAEKDRAATDFKRGGQVLVSSEAGGEGRNFQFCHILFNFDLPWNPMKIEQRIGRLDRIGQTTNVLVYNFGVEGTLDERILDVLDKRIRVFSESVGALDAILGDVERDLQKLCLQDVVSAKSAIRRYEVDLQTQLERARAMDAQVKDLVMDMRSFRREEVGRLQGRIPPAGLDELRRFVEAALARYPSARSEEPSPAVLRITVPVVLQQRNRGLAESYLGSFNYRVALEDERLDFFAFGHPLIDVLIAESTADEFAPIPGAVVHQGNSADKSVLVDYEFRLTGVREERRRYSHWVTGEDIAAPSEMDQPRESGREVAHGGWVADLVAKTEAASRLAADNEARRVFEGFRTSNVAAFTEERSRLGKLYKFRGQSYEERITRNERLIAEATMAGGVDSRSVGARRGIITRDRRRLAAITMEEESSIHALEDRREPVIEVRLLNVTEMCSPPLA